MEAPLEVPAQALRVDVIDRGQRFFIHARLYNGRSHPHKNELNRTTA